MAFPLPVESSATAPPKEMPTGDNLEPLSELITSLTIDPSSGDEGFRNAMRSLISSLYRSCESDNLDLFQMIYSCLGDIDIFPDIELELLRCAIFKSSFHCSRHLAAIAKSVNICSVLSWMCVNTFDKETFQVLRDRGFKLEDCACKGMGVLKHCIINGDEKLVEVCLQNGCKPNSVVVDLPVDDDHTPQVAVEEFSPLMCAILYAKADIVKTLLDYGADMTAEEVCGMTPLEATVYASKPTETELILKTYQSNLKQNIHVKDIFLKDVQKAFHNAVSLAPSPSVKRCMDMLLENGADVNALDVDHCSPLLSAIESKFIFTISYLIQNGCDVNMSGNVAMTIDNDENFHQVSPLRCAIDQSDDSIVDLLLKAGAFDESESQFSEFFQRRIANGRKKLSLADWSRLCIRKQLQPDSVENSVRDLEIPTQLKRFLNMC